VFVGLLLLSYEGGRWWLERHGELIERCGAEVWLIWLGNQSGVAWAPLVPGGTLGVLLLASLMRWSQRPVALWPTLLVIVVESLCAALMLWWISRNFDLLCQRAGVPLGLTMPAMSPGRLLSFVGAGIYEEIVFRFGLFTLLYLMLRLVLLPKLLALPLAATAAALLFALAHHVGPWGEVWRYDYFLFRTFAGLYFTALYLLRGLGVAIGAHVAYDLFVGLSAPIP
jgi:hypothetical protein